VGTGRAVICPGMVPVRPQGTAEDGAPAVYRDGGEGANGGPPARYLGNIRGSTGFMDPSWIWLATPGLGLGSFAGRGRFRTVAPRHGHRCVVHRHEPERLPPGSTDLPVSVPGGRQPTRWVPAADGPGAEACSPDRAMAVRGGGVVDHRPGHLAGQGTEPTGTVP